MFGLFRKKTLKERLDEAYFAYTRSRYTFQIDNDPLNSRVNDVASSRLINVQFKLEDGAPVRETLVKNFQGELLQRLLGAAGERRASRREYGERWEAIR